MRLSKAWTVASKDFSSFTKHKNVLLTIISFEGIISIGLPFFMNVITRRASAVALLPNFMNAFSFWYVIGATLLPVTIASYSLIGEKLQNSLEPLLATPTTDDEILAGKSIAAFLPAISANFIGGVIFIVLADLFTHNTLNYYYYPNWDIAIILFLLAPLACILSVGFNVLVSSRANDVRAAQQLGALIILPLAAVYILTEIQVLNLDTQTLLIIAGILAVLDVLMFFFVRATFQREEILTKWK
jgi:ABC-2 type transport system permease protein